MSAPCLFHHLLKDKVNRPCKRCKCLKTPFTAECWESDSHFEFWAAENKEGKAITYRIFPKSDTLINSPKKRLKNIEQEYEGDLRKAWDEINKEFKNRPKVGMIWHLAGTNAGFARFFDFGKAKKFRPAYACEVASWLEGHKDEFLAMKDQTRLITELESYIEEDINYGK